MDCRAARTIDLSFIQLLLAARLSASQSGKQLALLDLKHTSSDADLVNTALRALLTIKGSGAMFGFNVVAAFTRHVGTAFFAKDHIRRPIEQPNSANPPAWAPSAVTS